MTDGTHGDAIHGADPANDANALLDRLVNAVAQTPGAGQNRV